MEFEWDDSKAAANLAKHRVSFQEATTVFEDGLSLTIPDPLHSEQEDRFVILGISRQQRLLVVVFTERNDTIRIIGARPAERRERRDYEQGNSESS